MLAGSDGVEDDVDGSLTGRVVRDRLELSVAYLVEDRCVVVGTGEPNEVDVVARVAQGTGEPLRLPCRASRVLITSEQLDVGERGGHVRRAARHVHDSSGRADVPSCATGRSARTAVTAILVAQICRFAAASSMISRWRIEVAGGCSTGPCGATHSS